ncbi:hypothetical protein FQA47_011012 [Oryzias melastigma]|uniref:Uncharacterized protein n=1 Tax=Oryzias melastigma TaxID=30732 RepID=A0A834F7E8_ORYME|nr:hypothetical protein FQA47_011012 [Oryzias melastigma]
MSTQTADTDFKNLRKEANLNPETRYKMLQEERCHTLTSSTDSPLLTCRRPPSSHTEGKSGLGFDAGANHSTRMHT